MSKTIKAYNVLWIVFMVLLVIAHFFKAEWYVGFVVGLFLSPELIGAADDIKDNTFSEFNWARIRHPFVRWLIGVDCAYLAYTSFQEPYNVWFALPLMIWLPAHLALPNMEYEVARSIKKQWNKLRGKS